MADTNETIAEIIAEMRRRSDEAYKGSFNYPECQENQIEYDEASEWADRIKAAHRRERRLLMSCARWILCHDIYGHIAKELLAECKEVLNDDGQFLFKEDEQ